MTTIIVGTLALGLFFGLVQMIFKVWSSFFHFVYFYITFVMLLIATIIAGIYWYWPLWLNGSISAVMALWHAFAGIEAKGAMNLGGDDKGGLITESCIGYNLSMAGIQAIVSFIFFIK
jgi:hypothetical protein